MTSMFNVCLVYELLNYANGSGQLHSRLSRLPLQLMIAQWVDVSSHTLDLGRSPVDAMPLHRAVSGSYFDRESFHVAFDCVVLFRSRQRPIKSPSFCRRASWSSLARVSVVGGWCFTISASVPYDALGSSSVRFSQYEINTHIISK
jgi:hypothetical protein